MKKQEYDNNGYPVDDVDFKTGLKYAAIGLFVVLPATAVITFLVILGIHLIFG